jgi:RNA polymerase sigma factor (sigma-70 family)
MVESVPIIMNGDDQEFVLLMKRILGGSEEAASVLLERYGREVLRAVRSGLSPQLRSKFDSQDFVQDVWASFFANPPPEGKFDQPKRLVAFLRRIACNKVATAARHYVGGEARQANREWSLNDSGAVNPKWFVANQLSPSEEANGREAWDRLVQNQPIVYQRVVVLLLEGKSNSEIAAELGIHARSVQRFMTKLLSGLKP